MTLFLVHWTQICKIFHLCSPHCGKKKRQRKAGSCCSPGFSWVLTFALSLGYAPSENHYIYLVIRPKWDPEHRQTESMVDMQANPTCSWLTSKCHVPCPFWNTPQHKPSPHTHTPFTFYLITPQHKWTATTRKYPVLTPEIILGIFFFPTQEWSGLIKEKLASHSKEWPFHVHWHTSMWMVFKPCRHH